MPHNRKYHVLNTYLYTYFAELAVLRKWARILEFPESDLHAICCRNDAVEEEEVDREMKRRDWLI